MNQQFSASFSPRPRSSRVRSQSLGTESSYEIIPSLSNFRHEQPQVRLPCHLTRPYTTRNPDFQGRGDILDQMDRALLPNTLSRSTTEQTGLKTFTLYGLGGVGKTQ